jgi:nodulation protein E
MKRVVITGVGCVTPMGLGVQALWDGLAQGRCAIGPVPWLAEEAVQCRNGGAVRDYDSAAHFTLGQTMMLDRTTQFALLAAQEALVMAALDLSPEEADRAAVYVGSAAGGAESTHQCYGELYLEGSPVLPRLSVLRGMNNATASQISLTHQLRGPSMCISSACASSLQAIGEATRLLRSGECEVAVAGGADACLNPVAWKAWEAIRVMSPDTCRPFSKGRKGIVLGEGAGIVVLESRERALARGATILAEVAGYGVNSEAQHIVKPSVSGGARALRVALAQADLAPQDIDYVNTHGTGTVLSDRSETEMIRAVFGDHASRLAVSSTKSAIGQLMGAAGAVELIAALMGFVRDLLPPTLNYLEPDPACDLDYVTQGARPCAARAIVKNSFAFGGLNTSLALRRHEAGAA